MKDNSLSQSNLASTDREDILHYLKCMIEDVLKEKSCKIYLFGSWARKEEKRTSDIDIAIEATTDLSDRLWIELRERIEESHLPYHVDLVNLRKASTDIIDKVRKEGILWKG